MTRTWKTMTVLTPPLQMRMIALAIVRQGFTPAEVKGGYGCQLKEEGAE